MPSISSFNQRCVVMLVNKAHVKPTLHHLHQNLPQCEDKVCRHMQTYANCSFQKSRDAKLCQCMPAYAEGKQRHGRRPNDEESG